MRLETVVGISSILGSLSLVVSVILLIREVRARNNLERAANSQAMVEISGPFYLAMAQDRQLAELFARGARNFDELDEIDRRRCRSLLIWWLIFFENIFYQRRRKLLDRHSFKPWWRDLKLFVREQNFARHWDEIKEQFQEEFAAGVTELIAEMHRADSGGKAG
jgi:hypothetical protein